MGVVIGLVLAAAGYFLVVPRVLEQAGPRPIPGTPENNEVCIQVITSARDPKTGAIREFPTPCDVPDGWETVQNDVPTLDDYGPQ